MTGKKICLVNASLAEPGSGNFIMTLMANHWAEAGCEVSVLTFNNEITPIYELDSCVTFHPLDLFYSSSSKIDSVLNFIRRLRVIRRAVKSIEPDIVICFLEDPSMRTVFATRGLGVPVVCISLTDVLRHPTSLGRRIMQDLAFSMSDRFVVLTEKIKQSLPWWIRRRTEVVPNPIVATEKTGQIPEIPKPYILAVGRLLKPKRHQMLINVFSQLASRFPDWNLAIVGGGPEHDNLEKVRDSLGLADRVFLPGYVDYVGDWLANADIFAFPSLYEGFPLAVCEALLEELPVVVSNFPSGPECVVDDGESGYIVPLHSEEAFVEALGTLMESVSLRERFGKKGKAIAADYGSEQVLSYWDDLVADVVSGR